MAQAQIDKFLRDADAMMAKYPTITLYDRLQEVEDKAGYSKVYFFAAFVVIVLCSITLFGGTKLIVDLVGFVYPAYMSFKSIDSGSQDDTQWLTYWVVFSFASLLEGCFGFVVALIPMYFWIKIIAIIYMYHPKSRGAQTLYEQILRPLLLPYLDFGGTKKD